jgi:hypothetical protein
VASGVNDLIMFLPHIKHPNRCILSNSCRQVLFAIHLIMSKINIALEFDTMGRSRLLYRSKGVALIIPFSRQTHLAWWLIFNSKLHE